MKGSAGGHTPRPGPIADEARQGGIAADGLEPFRFRQIVRGLDRLRKWFPSIRQGL